jgi:hypothetical protein
VRCPSGALLQCRAFVSSCFGRHSARRGFDTPRALQPPISLRQAGQIVGTHDGLFWVLPSAVRSTAAAAAGCWRCPIWGSRRGSSCSVSRRDFPPWLWPGPRSASAWHGSL